MFGEFREFLKQYSVIGLAIAVIMGGKVNEFVSTTVADLFMPLIGALLPGGNCCSGETGARSGLKNHF